MAGSPASFIFLMLLLGLLIGSFLNVVIYRLPIMMEKEWRSQCAELLENSQSETGDSFNLMTPSSRCPACDRPIKAYENIPLLSYLFMRGRCACGKTGISPQYPLIEALTGILSGIVAWRFGFGVSTATALLLTWALIALSVIDIQKQLLPDNITLPFLWLGIALALFGIFTDLESSVIGTMAGYLSLWSVYQLFRLLTGKEGMGYGDFKLLAMLCAWQGWQYLVAIIIVSSLVGALVGITLIVLRGRDRNIPIPFGPFLAAAGWITLLWGDTVNRLYLDWAGL